MSILEAFAPGATAHANRVMLCQLATRLSGLAVARIAAAEVARKRWRLFTGWRLYGEARGYMDAAEFVLIIARNL